MSSNRRSDVQLVGASKARTEDPGLNVNLLIARLQDVTFERFAHRLRHELRFFRHNQRTVKLLRRHVAAFGNPHLFVVGARDGLDLRWRSWVRKGLVTASGVEPDENECARLRRADPEFTLYPLALGDKSGPSQFYRTVSPYCSSCLEPDIDVLSAYPLVSKMCAIEAVAPVQLCRFADAVPRPISEIPDFLQIDVQGFEYQVLEGFGQHLEQVLCIEQECHFRPLYKGTRTFPTSEGISGGSWVHSQAP
jgi:FkbM family methyltransferase